MQAKIKENCPSLYNLWGANFYQSWRDYEADGSFHENLSRAAQRTSTESARRALDDLATFCEKYKTECEISDAFDLIGVDYDPKIDGGTYLEFISATAAALRLRIGIV
jgi:hypothetical protein